MNKENKHLANELAIDLLSKMLVIDHVFIWLHRRRESLHLRLFFTPTLILLENFDLYIYRAVV